MIIYATVHCSGNIVDKTYYRKTFRKNDDIKHFLETLKLEKKKRESADMLLDGEERK